MISRIWHGWTPPDKADAYESLLKGEIFVNIGKRKINGYRGIQLFRRKIEKDVEFITIMWFDSLDAVKEFAGEEYEKSVVPQTARDLLSRFDSHSQHYEVRADVKS